MLLAYSTSELVIGVVEQNDTHIAPIVWIDDPRTNINAIL